MQSLGIKELQTNPAKLTKSLESDEWTMITKRSKPIGLAISFDDDIMHEGLKTALMARAYEQGLISLGQAAEALRMDKKEVMQRFSAMGIDVVDYDFSDDLQTAGMLG